MHTLGFFHEHNRKDRDKFVKIRWDNIPEAQHFLFTAWNFSMSNFHVFDHSSVMLYGPNEIFAIDPWMRSIVAQSDWSIQNYSFGDISTINQYYCKDYYKSICGANAKDCKNGGYLDKTCKCMCEGHTEGETCETVTMDFRKHLMKTKTPLSRTITEDEYFSHDMNEYESFTLVAKPREGCNRVRVTGTATGMDCQTSKVEITTDVDKVPNKYDGEISCRHYVNDSGKIIIVNAVKGKVWWIGVTSEVRLNFTSEDCDDCR